MKNGPRVTAGAHLRQLPVRGLQPAHPAWGKTRQASAAADLFLAFDDQIVADNFELVSGSLTWCHDMCISTYSAHPIGKHIGSG